MLPKKHSGFGGKIYRCIVTSKTKFGTFVFPEWATRIRGSWKIHPRQALEPWSATAARPRHPNAHVFATVWPVAVRVADRLHPGGCQWQARNLIFRCFKGYHQECSKLRNYQQLPSDRCFWRIKFKNEFPKKSEDIIRLQHSAAILEVLGLVRKFSIELAASSCIRGLWSGFECPETSSSNPFHRKVLKFWAIDQPWLPVSFVFKELISVEQNPSE